MSQFCHTQSVENIKEIEGGPFGEKNLEKKSHSTEKKLKGGPFGIFQHPF